MKNSFVGVSLFIIESFKRCDRIAVLLLIVIYDTKHLIDGRAIRILLVCRYQHFQSIFIR